MADPYVTVQEIRDEGVPTVAAGGPSDAKVLEHINTWQAFIERATRQWFVARAAVMSINGNESNLLQFPVPIVSITYIKLNNSTEELDTSLYKVHNSYSSPDDRWNPRIELATSDDRDIFSRPYGRLMFRKGEQNQEISGSFGFVESDGSPPLLIKRALLKLTIEKLMTPIYSATIPSFPIPPPPSGPLLSEKTDGHARTYAQAGGPVAWRRPGLVGVTADREILDIIKLHKAPIALGSPVYRHIQ